MDRSVAKYPLVAMLALMLAAFIAVPGIAFASDEADTVDTDTTLVEENAVATQESSSDTQEPMENNAVAEENQAANTAEDSSTPSTDIASDVNDPIVDEPVEGADVNNGDVDDASNANDGYAISDDASASEPAEAAVDETDEANVAADAESDAAATAEAAAATTVAAQAVQPKAAQKKAKKTSKYQPLADGWYYIQSAKVLSIVLTAVTAGKNAVVRNDKALVKQRWIIKYNAAKQAYSLYNASLKKYLSIKSTKKGANVRLVKSGSNAKSLWVITANAAGGYTLKAYSCKYLLDINGGKKVKSGANVDINKKKKSGGKIKSYQRWHFLPIDVDYSSSNVDLGDGYYVISLLKATSKSVTVPGSTKANGAQLTSNSYGAALNQKYVLHKESDGNYTLRSIASAKYLTIDGTKVAQQEMSGDDTQKWKVVSLGNGVSLVNVATGKALSISGASTADGAKAVAANPANVPAQRFKITRKNILDNGYYYFRISSPSSSANVATVTSGSKKNGAKVSVQKQTYYNDFGTFKVTHLGGGVYKLTNLESGKVLIASGASAVQGAESGNNAKWRVTMNPNGGVTLTNVATNKVLASEAAAGSNVQALTENGAVNESWYVQKAQVLKKYQKKALKKILQRGSKKNYYLFADLAVPRMMIWERANKKAEWKLKYDYVVAYGRMEGGKTVTPLGDYRIYGKLRWLDSEGDWNGYWSAPWAVRWSWAWFHARTHYYKHSPRVVDKRLGLPISNGCIRQPDKYAKWIFDNHKKLRKASVTVWWNGHF